MIDEGERFFIRMMMATVGGSLLAVFALPWQTMSWSRRIYTFVAAGCFGQFGAPAIATLVSHFTNLTFEGEEAQGGIRFFGAAIGLFLMPAIQNKIRKSLGLTEEDEA